MQDDLEGKASLLEILQYVRGSHSSRTGEIFVLASSKDESRLEDTLGAVERVGRGIDVMYTPGNQHLLRMKFRNCIARIAKRCASNRVVIVSAKHPRLKYS